MTEGAFGVGGNWGSKRVYCLLISRAAMHKSRRKRRKNSKNQLPRRPLSASMTADWSGWKKKADPLLEAASMVRVSSCFWPPASVSNSGIYGRGGGLGIRGRCHRLLWITFMKAPLPPSPLSHPPKNLLPQQCCCRCCWPLASQSRSPFQTETAAMAEEERAASLGNSPEVCLHFPRISGIIREIK